MSLKLAFVGKAGAGKTTIANELVERYRFVKLSFAAPLKKFAEEILMRPIDKTDPLDRKFLQVFGTDLCRARDKEVWVKHLKNTMYNSTQFVPVKGGVVMKTTFECPCVVDDCRFLNEAEYLKKEGFYIIRIIGRSTDIKENKNHASEVEQDSIPVDFELDNSGSIEETMDKLIHNKHLMKAIV